MKELTPTVSIATSRTHSSHHNLEQSPAVTSSSTATNSSQHMKEDSPQTVSTTTRRISPRQLEEKNFPAASSPTSTKISFLRREYWTSPKGQPHFFLVFSTCCILGNYARSGILKLSDYNHSFVASKNTLFPNLVSCFIMGMFQIFNSPEFAWFTDYPHLFTGVTTGFCGCLSSYSSMMLEVFLFSTSLNKTNIAQHTTLPNRAYGIMEFLSVLLSQMFASLGGYIFGRAFAHDIICSNNLRMNNIVKFFHYLFVWLAIPLIILIIVLSAVYDNYAREDWTVAPLFGIIGAFTRYYVSAIMNPWCKTFFIGTYTCNQFAVLVLSFLTIVQRGKDSSLRLPIVKGKNACHIVEALESGYCGSLSTISTFINEGYKLPLSKTLIYFISTFAVSYIMFVVTLGAFSWSRGLIEPVC